MFPLTTYRAKAEVLQVRYEDTGDLPKRILVGMDC